MTDPVGRPVLVRHEGPRTQVVLQAPERSNRITVRAMRHLIAALEEAHADNALILDIRATGDDFSLGRDQAERLEGMTRKDSLGLILRANELLTTFPGVSVCLVQGRAFGFGAGLAVQSDITVAGDTAVLAYDEVLHGLAPLVVAEYLPQYTGQKAAYELILTGRHVPAQEALALGMVNRLVAPGRLERSGDELIERLQGFEPGALRLMKRFRGELARGVHDRPAEAGVAQLDAWLAAGRPAVP